MQSKQASKKVKKHAKQPITDTQVSHEAILEDCSRLLMETGYSCKRSILVRASCKTLNVWSRVTVALVTAW